KPQFLIEDHDRLSPNRKARVRIAGPRLIQLNASQRSSAARKEAFRQGDDLRERWRGRSGKSQGNGIAIRYQDADAGRPRKAPTSFDWRISRILKEEP